LGDGRKSVADMRPGQVAVISGFTEESIASRLLEMGFIPGSSVRFNFTAPPGDPICVSVSGYDLAIRISEAATITIIS
jgi:ferrous iron transport protein A